MRRASTVSASCCPRRAAVAATAVALALASCADPTGLRRTPDGNGPLVVWKLDALPLPEIPLPNDLATRADPDSPTRRRLNVPLRGAVTQIERRTRQRINQLEGFSIYGGISVQFSEPLDLANIIARHHRNDVISDDVVVLINVDPESAHYGETVPLDLGQGSFPEALPRLNMFWSRDPRAKQQSLLFDASDEDTDGDGVLDPKEDTDHDGYLDLPNVYPEGGDPLDDLVTFYERVTNTLLARPLLPLQEETRYAVVLTRHLLGADGSPVRSPWAYVNHARQTAALEPLRTLLPEHGLSVDDVAFAWSFTTQGPTRDLQALRAGLYGSGPFSRLKAEYPPKLSLQPATDKGQNRYLVRSEKIIKLLDTFGSVIKAGILQITDEGKKAILDSLRNIDYFVVGELEGPNLIVPGATRTTREPMWRMNRAVGSASYASHRIPFLCAIPRADRGEGAPFPVAIYAHGYGSTRLEQLAFSGNIARYGIATCSIDAIGHGINLAGYAELLRLALKGNDLGPLFDAIYPGRAVDVDNDGQPESGADFVSADLFRTRDNIRQTVLDLLVFVRALRRLDGTRRGDQDFDGDGKKELAGDFDGDGKVDLGGPGVDYYAWGTSLGGIISSIVAGVEPAIVAAAPQAVGGGLIDIVRRSTQGAVVHSVLQRMLGPIFIGEPVSKGSDQVAIYTLATSGDSYRKKRVARVSGIEPGDRVVAENLVNGAKHTAFVASDRGFRVSIPADALDGPARKKAFALDPTDAWFSPHRLENPAVAGDALRFSFYEAGSSKPRAVVERFSTDVTFEGLVYPRGAPLVALSWGYGLPRNSPRLRRMVELSQIAVDAADPISYAPHYRKAPLKSPYDEAEPGTNVLIIATAGDRTVPVATGVALARAAGAVELYERDARFGRSPNQELIHSYVIEGLARLRRYDGANVVADPEDFSRGKHAPSVPRLPAPLRLQRRIGGGLVALRIPLLNPRGQHAFLLPTPKADFDTNTFMIHMVARFLSSGGKLLPDDVCMATASCSWIPKIAAPR